MRWLYEVLAGHALLPLPGLRQLLALLLLLALLVLLALLLLLALLELLMPRVHAALEVPLVLVELLAGHQGRCLE